jgi:hypothetical protein
MNSRRVRLIFIVLSTCFCSLGYGQNGLIDTLAIRSNSAPHTYILKGVNVVNPVKRTISYNRTVAINADTVRFVKGNWRSWFMKGVKIESKGKFITPGLVDAHVHLHCNYEDRLQFVAAGVTAVITYSRGPDIEENRVADSIRLPFPIVYGEGAINMRCHTMNWSSNKEELPIGLAIKGNMDMEYQSDMPIAFNHTYASSAIERAKEFHTFMLGRYYASNWNLNSWGAYRRFHDSPNAKLFHDKWVNEEMLGYTNSISPMIYGDYKIMFGTDVQHGYSTAGLGNNILKEVYFHKPLGLRADQILKGLCVTPYEFLQKPIPLVEVGQQADFVLYDENPLIKIETIGNPWMVIMRGYAMNSETLKLINNYGRQ